MKKNQTEENSIKDIKIKHKSKLKANSTSTINANELKNLKYINSPIKNISCISYKSLPGKINSFQSKVNQDSFLILTNVLGLHGVTIFGIFDGHGTNGQLVSDYCKKFFETFFNNLEVYTFSTSSNKSKPTKEELYSSLTDKNYSLLYNAFTMCENNLKTEVKFDTTLSGTTVVLVISIGEFIICANSGDSRAILTTKAGIRPLSFDHKPENTEEKARIQRAGGKVHPSKEYGKFIGPCRVWAKSGEYPGLAMSRSLGDFIAKSVGCTYAPEIVETRIDQECKFLVLASDGIFEVLDNHQVSNCLMQCFYESKFEIAAGLLVDKAVQQWNRQSTGQDDITTIIAFFESQL